MSNRTALQIRHEIPRVRMPSFGNNRLMAVIAESFLLSAYADYLGEEYVKNSDAGERKKKGQFFTPKEVATFMAQQFDIRKQKFRILDPGAGIGGLTAAFCELVAKQEKPVSVTADLYESDENVLPFLQEVLKKCKAEFRRRGHSFRYDIIKKNFVLDNPNFLSSRTLFGNNKEGVLYDYVLSNPPYYKLNKNSPEASLLKEFVCGQPNIYSFFMALSLEMLKPNGQMVFITPRSFCSGLYFKKFRKWLLRNSTIDSIHVFESRKDVFSGMKVLQENVIIKITAKKPDGRKQNTVIVTSSPNGQFENIRKISFAYQDLFHNKKDDVFIKIPSSQADVEIQHTISLWKESLETLGLKASTGPVVSFRAKEHLLNKDGKNRVPLLWMHNLDGFKVEWPVTGKKNKEMFIKDSKKTQNLLLPVKNYVLVKRFSSKEQKRRLYAGVMQKEGFGFEKVGIENHLNYIYKKNGCMSLDESFGVVALLNSAIMDRFFRMLNGNTQVNVVDINSLPFPTKQEIAQIGKNVRRNKPDVGVELDKLILEILGINSKILNKLY